MQLTGKQIVENGIVFNYCEEGVQQQGLDVRLANVYEVYTGEWETGYIANKGKTLRPLRRKINPVVGQPDEQELFILEPGYYEVDFMEGCKIPNNTTLGYKTRSSLVRCGAIVHSGQFDAGFQTEQMGAFLHVILPIKIEKGARIAQAVVLESYSVDDKDLYNGQWQNDKQRQS